MKKIKYWIEAMRLRTLPVSVAGVITAIGYMIIYIKTGGACAGKVRD